MKLIDTTDAGAHARMRTLVSGASAEREWQLAAKFRIHLVGMYFAEVGSEWGSDGKQQSDYLHHIEVVLSGRRQVVHERVIHALFSTAFSRSTGISPKDYLTRRLNQEALRWVINSDLKMKEIADKLRFSDEYYFSRFFKKLNGCSPVAYRRRWLRE